MFVLSRVIPDRLKPQWIESFLSINELMIDSGDNNTELTVTFIAIYFALFMVLFSLITHPIFYILNPNRGAPYSLILFVALNIVLVTIMIWSTHIQLTAKRNLEDFDTILNDE